MKHTQCEGTTATNPTLSVLVSGASFAGGLASAWWIYKLRYSVTVVEIAKGLRKGGTPVNIRDEVIDVVRRMNLLERIKSESLPPRPMTFLDANGLPLPLDLSQAEEQPDEEYEIERDVLLDTALRGSQGPRGGCLRGQHLRPGGNCKTKGGHLREWKTTLLFPCARLRWYPLRCEEDVLRRRVFFLFPGSFLQCYFSLTIVDKLLIAENTSQMLNVAGRAIMLERLQRQDGHCILLLPQKRKSTTFDRRNTGRAEAHDPRELRRRGLEDTPNCSTRWSVADDFYFDKLCQVRMRSWTKGRVALVGDAGYCPSPAAGMGELRWQSLALLPWPMRSGNTRAISEQRSGRMTKVSDPPWKRSRHRQSSSVMEMFLPRSEEAIQGEKRAAQHSVSTCHTPAGTRFAQVISAQSTGR